MSILVAGGRRRGDGPTGHLPLPAPFPAETSRGTFITPAGTLYTNIAFGEPTTSDTVRLIVPFGVVSGEPVRLAYTLHGFTGSPNHVDAAFMLDTKIGLIDRGFVIASPNTGGDSWGNAGSQTRLAALHDYLAQFWPVSKVLLHGTSMGALVAASAAGLGTIPADALVTIDGVLSLSYAWSTWPTGAGNVPAAHSPSSLAQAQTAGLDPCTVTPPVDLPVFAAASPDDTVAVKASNTDAWTARLAPATTTTVATAGAHVETDNFVPAQVLEWLDATFT